MSLTKCLAYDQATYFSHRPHTCTLQMSDDNCYSLHLCFVSGRDLFLHLCTPQAMNSPAANTFEWAAGRVPAFVNTFAGSKGEGKVPAALSYSLHSFNRGIPCVVKHLKRSGYKIWSYPISTAHHSLWALQTGYAYPLHSIQYLKSCDPHTGPMITIAALFLINAASNVMQSLRSSSSWRTLVQHQEIIPDRVSVGGRCDRYDKLVRFVHFTQPMALQSLSVCMFRVCTCVCVGGNRELGLRGNNSSYKVYSQLGMS